MGWCVPGQEQDPDPREAGAPGRAACAGCATHRAREREGGREREGEREGLVEAATRDLEGCRGFKGLNNGLKAGKRQAWTPITGCKGFKGFEGF